MKSKKSAERFDNNIINAGDIASDKPINIDKVKSRRRRLSFTAFTIFTAVVLCTATIGSFMYFTAQNQKKVQPSLEFTSGSGVINESERVVYAGFVDSARVEFIHGVSLIDKDSKEIISEDYEYTISLDNGFRAIYFDMDKLGLTKGKHSCVFKINVGFYSDENVYTYYQPVDFSTGTRADIGDIVFDHTTKNEHNKDIEDKKEQVSKIDELNSNEDTTKEQGNEYDLTFLYNQYWYSNPVTDGDTKTLTVYKFKLHGECEATVYTKKGNDSWKTKTVDYYYNIDGTNLSMFSRDESQREYYRVLFEDNMCIGFDDENRKLVGRKDNAISDVEYLFKIQG